MKYSNLDRRDERLFLYSNHFPTSTSQNLEIFELAGIAFEPVPIDTNTDTSSVIRPCLRVRSRLQNVLL